MIIVKQGIHPAHGERVLVVNERNCVNFPQEMLVLHGDKLKTFGGVIIGSFDSAEVAAKVLRDIVRNCMELREVYFMPDSRGEKNDDCL